MALLSLYSVPASGQLDETTTWTDLNLVLSERAPSAAPWLEIVKPASPTSVDLGTRQAVVVQWRINNEPVSNLPVTFSTSLGDLSHETVTTDESGQALVFVESTESGTATVHVQTITGQTAERTIVFEEQDSAHDVYLSGGREIPIQVSLERIGFQTVAGTPASAVEQIARERDLTLVQHYHRGVYIFEVDGRYTRSSLRLLARGLERNYPQIKLAGLVANTAAPTAAMIVDNRVLIGFQGEPRGLALEKLEEDPAVSSVESIEGCPTLFVATIADHANADILDKANELGARGDLDIAFAHANFVIYIIEDSTNGVSNVACDGPLPASAASNDPRYCQQWHHDNRGIGDATPDADIDTAEAWKISTGDKTAPLIAIIDSSFSITAKDLEPNLWTDPDNIHRGRDFDDDRHDDLLDKPPAEIRSHGTSVAGIAGAVADNTVGGRGVCPGCKLLLLRHGSDTLSTTKAMCFAISQGADVISNSWGTEIEYQSIKEAIATAAANDIPVVFAAASATERNSCGNTVELTSIDEHVIAVSSTTYLDDRTPSGIGDCVDVLAPSRKDDNHGITTILVYESDAGQVKHETTSDFGGTSAATPMVSGTIGLMLDVAPGLDKTQIQNALQDTADKFDAGCGYYDARTGFSDPSDTVPTHAYGRVNAFEAVSLVAPQSTTPVERLKRGHGGQDLFIRDHALDWGNTINPSNELFTPTNPRETIAVNKSIDIWLTDNDDVANVRVRNRGHLSVPGATLYVYWTTNRQLPELPFGFWNALGTSAASVDPNAWNLLRAESFRDPVPYSGASAAEAATVVSIDFRNGNFDRSDTNRLTLLAIVDAPSDRVLAAAVTDPPGNLLDVETAVAWDNNVALWAYAAREPQVKCGPISPVFLLALIVIAARRKRSARSRP